MGRNRLPLAVLLEMLVALCRRVVPGTTSRLAGINLLRGAVLPQDGSLVLHSSVDTEAGLLRIRDEKKHVLAEARLASALSMASWRSPDLPRHMDGTAYARALASLGYDYGPAFCRILSIRFNDQHSMAIIAGEPAEGLDLPPSVLDSCLQSMLFIELLARERHPDQGGDRLPVAIDRLRLHHPFSGAVFPLSTRCRLVRRDERETVGDLRVVDATGTALLDLDGVTLAAVAPSSALAGGRSPTDTLFTLDWRPAGPLVPERGSRRWLIWGDAAATAFTQALKAGGEEVHLGHPERHDDYGWTLIADSTTPAPLTVVDLQAADWHSPPSPRDGETIRGMARHLRRLCLTAGPGTRLWLVSSAAENIPLQAAVWGMGRCLGDVEQRPIWGGLVDIRCEGGLDWITRLRDLVTADGAIGGQYRWGKAGWLRPALVAAGDGPAMPPWFRDSGSLLITGGFGGLGRVIARTLVELGARHLVLTASTQPAAAGERAEWLRHLERRGVRVMVVAGDITHANAWENLSGRLDAAGMPPLAGLIHAAGAISDKALTEVSDDDMDRVLDAKLTALLRLLDQVDPATLDFVLFCSSVAGLLPAHGQSLYGGANAYLDALARQLAERGIPAHSLAWGPWTVGMASSAALEAYFRRQGWHLISGEEGGRILTAALSRPDAVQYAMSADWPLLARRSLRNDGPLADLAGAAGTAAPDIRLPDLSSLPATDRPLAALAAIIGVASTVLQRNPAELSPESNLTEMGLDSLMAVEMQLALAPANGADIALSELLGRHTLRQLALRLAVPS